MVFRRASSSAIPPMAALATFGTACGNSACGRVGADDDVRIDAFLLEHDDRHLREASSGELLDRLVVGVSADALNLRKKDRLPVFSEAERLEIVAALRCVDEVFVDRDTIGYAVALADATRDGVQSANARLLTTRVRRRRRRPRRRAAPPRPHGGPFAYISANTDLLGWAIERAAEKPFMSPTTR